MLLLYYMLLIAGHLLPNVYSYSTLFRSATRNTTWGKTMHDTVGTGIVKEGAAEIAIYVLRKDEAEAESEVWKWRNQFQSTQEIINSLKIQLKTLMTEYQNSNQL